MHSSFDLDQFIDQALTEDVGSGDLTASALFDDALRARGTLRLREEGVCAGIDVALRVFERLDGDVSIRACHEDGDEVGAGAMVGEVEGAARTVVTGERVALNLLARLSGIATLTRRFVQEVEGTGVEIVDTRKTTPLLRALEKHAVRMGGGVNHRFGLFDAILVKDNHLDLIGARSSAERMREAARKSIASVPEGTFVQIEVETIEEAVAVAQEGVDSILFDNFRPDELEEAVQRARESAGARRLVLEASGGLNLQTARLFAMTGVDRMSIGALTHAARSLDVTLEIERVAL